MVDFNSNAIFGLPDIDLHNRILISSQNSDLKKSTSSTARPKLQTACARPLIGQIGQKMVCDLVVGPYSHGVAKKAQLEKKYFRTLPNPWATIIQYALPKLLTQIWLGGPFTQRRLNIMQKLRRFFFRDLQRAEDQFTSDVRVLVISGNVAFVILKRRTPEALKLFSCSPPSLFSYTSSLCSMQSSVAKILQALSFPLHRKLS